MGCKYCYVDAAKPQVMDPDTAFRAVDLAVSDCGRSVGIIFFGGEPLLRKDLIYSTIEYAKAKSKQAGIHMHFKVTTNGTLLDEAFMEYSARENLFIALSHDGVREAHDLHRVDRGCCGTFDRLSDKIDLLLRYRPYAPVMMTVNPDTVMHYADSVKYLYARGFKYIICSLNYAADWPEGGLAPAKGAIRGPC